MSPWQRALLLLVLCYTSRGEVLEDVTTIYDLGSDVESTEDAWETYFIRDVPGRVHMRTNSLGLPLYNQTNFNVLTPVSKDRPRNVSCYFGDWHCSWAPSKGWTNIQTRAVRGKMYKVSKMTKIVLKRGDYPYSGYSRYITFFTSNQYSDYKFVLYLNPSNLCPQIVSGCTRQCCGGTEFNLRGDNGMGGTIYCNHYSNAVRITSVVYPVDLAFRFSDTGFASLEWSSQGKTLVIDLPQQYSLIESNLHVSMSANDYFDYLAPEVHEPVFSSSSEGEELLSPMFELRNHKSLCVSLMVQAGVEHPDSVLLQISLKDIARNTQVNHNITEVKVEWSVKQINFDFKKKITGFYQLVIKTTSSKNVRVSHITTCNGVGEDVYLLPPAKVSYQDLPKTKDQNKPLLEIYTASNSLETSRGDADGGNVSSLPLACLNGGVPTAGGCQCAPGFTGDDCRTGCGRNRFGRDCGGRCSVRVGECRGLLMCNRATKCQCAPGYTGSQCGQTCDSGWYGNDCERRCGHCTWGEQCDVYGGECASCQPGYRLPHCTLPYVYYSLKPELSSPDYGVIKVEFDPEQFTPRSDQPQLYQIQIREKEGPWQVYTTKSLKEDRTENKIEEYIEHLKTGQFYDVKVLLLDASFNKYDGDLVQNSEIVTKCEIPESYDYNIQYSSNTTSLTFTWMYKNTSEHWCPVDFYEVSWKEDYQWLSENTKSNSFSLAKCLSGLATEFEVRAKTTTGFAPYSDTITASTLYDGASGVRNLRMTTSQSTSVTLAWDPPNYSHNRIYTYNIQYKCVEQPACSPGCVNATEGALSQQDTSVTLSSLLPFARYRVTVAPDAGPHTTTFVGTDKIVPVEKPVVSSARQVERTNTSLTVFWDAVPVCSGFMLGYNYQLTKESEPLKVLKGGFTRDTGHSFRNLSASTPYLVRVYIVTVAGWNPDSYLEINTSTSATVPEAVQRLEVYKRSRSSVGLRWAEPKALYGRLQSFAVAVRDGGGERTHTVEPQRCPAWPHLYCHTLQGLRANRLYTVSVSARNAEVAEDGARASVSAVTKEASPSAPVGLRLSNASQASVSLRWEHPDLANGLLRSFLVSVEETERLDQDACCQVYPLIETAVSEETHTYETEVCGLQPASTYYVSVSAKTVGLGPAQSLVVHTRPPHLPLPPPLLPSTPADRPWTLMHAPHPQANASQLYAPLVKAYLLLAVVSETTESGSGISDVKLDSLLRQYIGAPFVFVAEYSQGDVAADLLHNELEAGASEWGGRPPTLPPSGRLVAAQVTEYAGMYNADLATTDSTITDINTAI